MNEIDAVNIDAPQGFTPGPLLLILMLEKNKLFFMYNLNRLAEYILPLQPEKDRYRYICFAKDIYMLFVT